MQIAQFELVGALEGTTINLGGHQFVDGVFTYGPSEDHVYPSPEDVQLKATYLGKCYQAYLVGSQAAADAKAKLEGGEAPNQGEGDVQKREDADQAERDEKPVTDRARKGAVRDAIAKLDATNDEHWTEAGLPSVSAVRELSGNTEVSRQDIASLAPKLTREEAAKVAADPLD